MLYFPGEYCMWLCRMRIGAWPLLGRPGLAIDGHCRITPRIPLYLRTYLGKYILVTWILYIVNLIGYWNTYYIVNYIF